MKKLISLLLAVIMIISMCACSSDPTAEAIEAFRAYVVENGTLVDNMSVVFFETNITDTILLAAANDTTLKFCLSYTLGSVTTEDMSTTLNTHLYLKGYENQQKNCYYVAQVNTVETFGQEVSKSYGAHLTPDTLTWDAQLDVHNTTTIDGELDESSVNDDQIKIINDGLNTILEVFSDALAASGLNLTIADFGFTSYEINTARPSDMRSEAWVKEPVPPAPIEISVKNLKVNSIGTKELYLNYTNTGDTEITAFDFIIECYDAYGERVIQFGINNKIGCSFQEPIAPGKTKSSGWSLYGFDNTQTVKMAVTKYRLAGQDATTIPEVEYVWFEG